jgi:hypothetical protein
LCARAINTEHQHHERIANNTTIHPTNNNCARFETQITRIQTIQENHATLKPPSRCSSTKIPQRYVPSHRTSYPAHPPQPPPPLYTPLTPPQLISQCTSHFKIGNDTASLLRISDSLSTLSTFRTQHLQSLQSSLSQLSRTHQTLSANHSHTLSQHNAIDHASEILRLDTEKFKIAKQASDLEIEGERLQAELQRLGHVAADLDEEGVEGGASERVGEDATV